MLKQIAMAFLVFLGSVTLMAHEGHGNTPGTLKANHGGVVKPGNEINLEFVVFGNEVKFYPASHDGKDFQSSEVQLTATAKLPKGKAEVLNLLVQEGVYSSQVDFKGAFRIEILVNVDHKGKKSSFKIQIEK